MTLICHHQQQQPHMAKTVFKALSISVMWNFAYVSLMQTMVFAFLLFHSQQEMRYNEKYKQTRLSSNTLPLYRQILLSLWFHYSAIHTK